MTREMEAVVIEELADIVRELNMSKTEYGQENDVDPGEAAQFRVRMTKKRLEILLKTVQRFGSSGAVSASEPLQVL